MSMVRHCERCDTDYRPEILNCAECGEMLTWKEDEPGERAHEEPPPGDYRSLYYSGNVQDLEPLTEALTRANIPYQVQTTEDAVPVAPHQRFDLRVRDEEREQAHEVLGSLPQAADLGIVDTEAERNFDPQKGYRNCPACAATLPPGALSCPDCGLALAGSLEPLSCPTCGWQVSSADPFCPNCGSSLGDTPPLR